MDKKYYSTKQEKMIADFLDWRTVSGSGSRHTYPGDVVSDSWLGECKTHVKPNQKISFNYSVWKKIVDEAASQFKHPVLFCDDGTQLKSHTWCMFPSNITHPLLMEFTVSIPHKTNLVTSHEVLQSLLNTDSDIVTGVILKLQFQDIVVHITNLETFDLLA